MPTPTTYICKSEPNPCFLGQLKSDDHLPFPEGSTLFPEHNTIPQCLLTCIIWNDWLTSKRRIKDEKKDRGKGRKWEEREEGGEGKKHRVMKERRKTERREEGRSLFFYGMWNMSPYLLKSDYSLGNDHKGLYLNMLLNLDYLLSWLQKGKWIDTVGNIK